MRLPPLNAIRIFEIAGRLENFSKAANELHLTPGAVSRQIRKLEEFLEIPLFTRSGTEVHLTERGRLYLGTVQEALGRLEAGTRHLMATQAPEPLHIWGSRFFIRLWLVPRLQDFHEKFPDQEVMITSALPSDPMPKHFDIGIRLGNGVWPGYRSELLVRRSLVPVCSPDFLQKHPTLKSPQDLQHATLIQTPAGANEWTEWYASTGAPQVPLLHRMTFTSTDVAYSAALDGAGVVLGRRGFFENDLRKGNLVVLFDHDYVVGDGFYMIHREHALQQKRTANFLSWIRGLLLAPSV